MCECVCMFCVRVRLRLKVRSNGIAMAEIGILIQDYSTQNMMRLIVETISYPHYHGPKR